MRVFLRWHLCVSIFLTLTEQFLWTRAFTSPMHTQTHGQDLLFSLSSSAYLSPRYRSFEPVCAKQTDVFGNRGQQCLLPLLSMKAEDLSREQKRNQRSNNGQKSRIPQGTYQEAALSGLLTEGQLVPDDWLPGEHFDYSETHTFKPDEMVVVLCTGGSVRFGRIESSTTSSEIATEGEAANTTMYSVKIGGVSFRSKNRLSLSAGELGKILPLSSKEIQRLGIPRPVQDEDGRKSTQAGLLASLKTFLDVDKQIAPESLPFQPMFSRRTSASSASAPSLGGQEAWRGGQEEVAGSSRQLSAGAAARLLSPRSPTAARV